MDAKKQVNKEFINQSLVNQVAKLSYEKAEREALIEELGQENHELKQELEQLREELKERDSKVSKKTNAKNKEPELDAG